MSLSRNPNTHRAILHLAIPNLISNVTVDYTYTDIQRAAPSGGTYMDSVLTSVSLNASGYSRSITRLIFFSSSKDLILAILTSIPKRLSAKVAAQISNYACE